ncbi:MAG: hypothetical protein GXX85_06490 [Ignavibacteria bacterium]|nr:hypothetical protein [Ignavibacteria bacterium]
MKTFILWLILLVLCWPLALAAIIVYPVIWLLLLPFRLIGITLISIFDIVKLIISLPSKILR